MNWLTFQFSFLYKGCKCWSFQKFICSVSAFSEKQRKWMDFCLWCPCNTNQHFIEKIFLGIIHGTYCILKHSTEWLVNYPEQTFSAVSITEFYLPPLYLMWWHKSDWPSTPGQLNYQHCYIPLEKEKEIFILVVKRRSNYNLPTWCNQLFVGRKCSLHY